MVGECWISDPGGLPVTLHQPVAPLLPVQVCLLGLVGHRVFGQQVVGSGSWKLQLELLPGLSVPGVLIGGGKCGGCPAGFWGSCLSQCSLHPTAPASLMGFTESSSCTGILSHLDTAAAAGIAQ